MFWSTFSSCDFDCVYWSLNVRYWMLSLYWILVCPACWGLYFVLVREIELHWSAVSAPYYTGKWFLANMTGNLGVSKAIYCHETCAQVFVLSFLSSVWPRSVSFSARWSQQIPLRRLYVRLGWAIHAKDLRDTAWDVPLV